jgi:hypothetical protein
MSTFIINLDELSSEKFREIIGFILRVGLNFRKIDLVKDDKTSSSLIVEVETKTEEKSFSDFLNKNDVHNPMNILSDNNVTIGLKVIGKFKQLGENAKSSTYYQDKSTGRKFVIV